MIVKSLFKPAWWLPGGHLQTIFPTLVRKVRPPVSRWERIELPDGDFVELAHACASLPPDAPQVVLLHGLGGSVDSTYAAGMMHALNAAGWRATLMHFRGAGREPNRQARAYHSGDTHDLDVILRILAAREPGIPLAVVGVSLGGNVLLKWLGEQGKQDIVTAAVAISVPYVLRLVATRMERGVSRAYQAWLLARIRRDFARKMEASPELMAPWSEQIESARCFWTFDDRVTAPLHQFDNVHAYYREASCRQYIPGIRTQTLLLHAKDDPFMIPEVLPDDSELPDGVTLELSKHGGHVGFVSGSIPGKPVWWLEARVVAFLKPFLSRREGDL